MHITGGTIASYFFMKDNNIEEEIARNMHSHTKMMLNKKNLDEIIDSKEEIDFQSAEKR